MDLIEGFEDQGHLKRSNSFGTQAMVFLAREIYSSWKMPLSDYISSNAMKYNTLKEAILYIVGKKCMEAGLYITAVVCDQGTNNQLAFKNLGMSVNKPYFLVDEKIFFRNFRYSTRF